MPESRALTDKEGYESCSKKNQHWYCAGCGERYYPSRYLQRRLLIIVPPAKKAESNMILEQDC
eukprot:7139628-Prorocentrum_lima.AAC.1